MRRYDLIVTVETTTTGPTKGSVARSRADAAGDEAKTEAWVRMRQLTHASEVMGQLHGLAAEVGIIPGAAKAVQFLSVDEPTSMRNLATRLRCDNSYVTTIVDSLEDAGVAVREQHPTDRRIKVIVLTEAGKKYAERVNDVLGTPPPAFGSLSAEESVTLRDLLRKLTPSGS